MKDWSLLDCSLRRRGWHNESATSRCTSDEAESVVEGNTRLGETGMGVHRPNSEDSEREESFRVR